MINRQFKKLALAGFALTALSTVALGSAFQLFEQSAAGTGDAHSGDAVRADASSEWYNPAAMTQVKHKEVSVGAVVVPLDVRFKGSIDSGTGNPTYQVNNAQGGTFNMIPNFHYVTPLSDKMSFGFGINVPFGLKTNYGLSTPVRYAATKTSLQTIDISPSLGWKVANNISFGVGFDAQHIEGDFDRAVDIAGNSAFDTLSYNSGSDWGYGFHTGMLFQEGKNNLGISYHSQIAHKLSGTSRSINYDGTGNLSDNLSLATRMPAFFDVSYSHLFDSRDTLLMGMHYTEWDTFSKLVLYNVADSNGPLVVAENYRNTWEASVGFQHRVDSNWLWRLGAGFDEHHRTLQTEICNFLMLIDG